MLKIFQLFMALIFILSLSIFGQQIKTPRPSPDATVIQFIGVTEVKIDYSSPGVKGTELPAGTYGIHTIPGESDWEFVFSKDTKIDGSSNFNKEKEVLRVKAKPEEHHFMERMTFLFTDVTDNSASVNLLWDKLKVSFNIETNTQELFLSKAREQLSWSPTFQAAQYCLTTNTNLEEAYKWIEASCLINEVYWNTRVKAQIQNKLGMKNEAIATMEKAIGLGSKMESAPFDFDNMKAMLAEWKK